LIDYVPFDMPSSRPGKKWKAGFLFAKPVGNPTVNERQEEKKETEARHKRDINRTCTL
jgi:hypothetical protein